MNIIDFESYFDVAVNHNYYRNMSKRQLEFLVHWYKEETGIQLNDRNICGACILNICKEVGEYYYKKQANLIDLEMEVEVIESKLEEVKPKKKKATKPIENEGD